MVESIGANVGRVAGIEWAGRLMAAGSMYYESREPVSICDIFIEKTKDPLTSQSERRTSMTIKSLPGVLLAYQAVS